MEMCCSFESLVVDDRGYNPEYRKGDRQIVPMLSCDKEIAGHLAHFSFTSVFSEYDLILSTAAVTQRPNDVHTWTVCPLHRSRLGPGWTQGVNTKCNVRMMHDPRSIEDRASYDVRFYCEDRVSYASNTAVQNI